MIPPLPAVPSGQVALFLVQLAVLLAAASGLGWLARRIGQPAVIGELLAGVLLGPSVLGHALPGLASRLWPLTGQTHLVDAVAQFGVVLLVGLAGAELDAGLVRRERRVVLWVSTGALVVPLALGIALGALAPRSLLGPGVGRLVFALFVGVALGVSAIPVIAKTLVDLNLLHRDVGQLTLAASAVDDALSWLLLSLVGVLATSPAPATSHGVARPVALAVAQMSVAVLAAVLLRRPVAAWLRRTTGGSERVAPVLLILLAGACGTAMLGLEPILGAFLVGVLLAGEEGRRALAPIRTVVLSVLAPVFLATAGLRVDVEVLRHPPVLLAAAVVVALATVGKIVGGYLGARLGGLDSWRALAIGAALNARGVVEIVVASVGLRLGVLTAATYTIVMVMAIVSSMLAPPLLRLAVGRVDRQALRPDRKWNQGPDRTIDPRARAG